MEHIKIFFDQKKFIILIGVGFLLFFMSQIQDIVMLFFVSFVLASALNPIVEFISKKTSRTVAVLLIYLIGLISVVLLFIPLIDILLEQVISFVKNLPGYTNNISCLMNSVVKYFHASMPPSEQIIPATSGFGQHFITESINFTMGIAGSFIIVFTAAMIVLYMLIDKEELRAGFLKFFPKKNRAKAEAISASISRKVGGYVIGQLVMLLGVAVFTTLGYWVLKLNYFILLGILTGVLDIIPIVGPFIAITLAILVALAQKPVLAVWVFIVFMCVQWGTNTFVKPAVFSKFLDLHPLAIIFALLVAAAKLGVVGVIVSPAIAATVCVLVDEFYLKKINATKNSEIANT